MIARAGTWTTEEVAAAVRGVHQGPARTLRCVGTDGREAMPEGLFVALRGARFDGHDHLDQAADRGAVAALVDRPPATDAGVQTWIQVPDTLEALRRLGAHHRRRWGGPLVALTGSNGKTTTKEMLAALLAPMGPVLKTEGNLNNRIGAPMTLLGLEAQRVGVIELGMNEPREIGDLTAMTDPQVAMLLNVGPAHIGRLGSMEAIAKAKGEIFEAAPKAVQVVNFDDARVMDQARRHPGADTITFGWGEGADVRIVERVHSRESEGQTVVLQEGMQRSHWSLPLAGAHHAANLAASWAACRALPPRVRPDREAASMALARFSALSGRGRTERIGDVRVVDESYNANRASVVASLDAVAERASGAPFGLLLGAMDELDDFSEAEHRAVGEHAAALGAAFLVAFGQAGSGVEAAAEGARAGGIPAGHFEDEAEVHRWLRPRLQAGTWWLVKGSRAARTERFIAWWRQEVAG